MKRAYRCFLWAVALGCLASLHAAGSDATATAPVTLSSTGAGQFRHLVWNAAAGSPHDVWAMAQGERGFLWLGTGQGLFQFDGVSFRQDSKFGATLGSSNITALSIFPSGDMWEGFYLGGVALIRHGKQHYFGWNDGFPKGWVLDFAQTQDGSVWAAAQHGLARYHDGRWQTIGNDWGLPPGSAGWVLVDRQGTLWVSGPSLLYFLPKGARRFSTTNVTLGTGAVLALDRDGVLWVSDKVRGTRSLPGVTASHPQLTAPITSNPAGFITSNRILFDRDGRMWGTDSQAGGIYVVLDPRKIRDGRSLHAADLSFTYKSANGLSSDLTLPLLCDREGNVWVGSNFGIDSFRLSSFSSVAGLEVIPGVDFNVTVDAAGQVWIANGKTIYKVDHGKLHAVIKLAADAHDLVGTEDGTLWFETATSVMRIRHGAVEQVSLPAGVTDARAAAFVSDGLDGIWIAFRNAGLYHWSARKWQRDDHASMDGTPTALGRDGDSLWIGYDDSNVVVRGHQRVSIRQKIGIGAISSFYLTTSLKLVGGEQGLARLKGDHFESLSSLGTERIGGISGITHESGNFWINTSKGVIRISDVELARAFQEHGYSPTYRRFGFRDGLPGFALQSKALPTIIVDGQGHIWIGADLGIAWVDPRRIRANTVAPHVEVVGISSAGKHYPADSFAGILAPSPKTPIRLPHRTSNLNIDYTATSLSEPDGINFRYRLSGVDKDWQAVGSRREAFYANLTPGSYVFSVDAQNEDGLWSKHPTSIEFQIPPMFYQTNTFRVASAVGLIAAILFLLKLRINQIAEGVRIRVNERYRERERIARELHDNLLQSVQGLIMIFRSVTARASPDIWRTDEINEVLVKADDVVAEVRDRVLDLRKNSGEFKDFEHEFRSIHEEFCRYWSQGLVSFRISVHGGERSLAPAVHEEVYWIGREAIINAYKHAEADLIEVNLFYEREQFRAEFVDNGCGIDHGVIVRSGKPGHSGLGGMRERARQIGGRLALRANQGGGTCVELRVPGASAYVRMGDVLKRSWRRSDY